MALDTRISVSGGDRDGYLGSTCTVGENTQSVFNCKMTLEIHFRRRVTNPWPKRNLFFLDRRRFSVILDYPARRSVSHGMMNEDVVRRPWASCWLQVESAVGTECSSKQLDWTACNLGPVLAGFGKTVRESLTRKNTRVDSVNGLRVRPKTTDVPEKRCTDHEIFSVIWRRNDATPNNNHA